MIGAEVVGRVGPLGVRFWDAVERRFVSEGLNVRVGPQTSPRRVTAHPNRSETFSARALPGLQVIEFGDGDDTYWSGVAKRAFVVEVDDPERRFLSFSIPVQLPNRGLFVWSCPMSPPVDFFHGAPTDAVPLFSAPARPVASMRAVIRAELRDQVTRAPAAGAVLTAVIDGTTTVRGIADAEGRVAIHFPYPEPRDFPVISEGSPPASTGVSSLAAHTWPVVLSAQYRASAGSVPYPDYPDLCTSFRQPAAALHGDSGGAPLAAQTLQMGLELMVRSTDAGTGKPLSYLLVRAP